MPEKSVSLNLSSSFHWRLPNVIVTFRKYITFYRSHFLRPEVTIYFRENQSSHKSKRATTPKQTFENIFADIFPSASGPTEIFSNDVDMVLEEDRLFEDRKQLTLLNSATPLLRWRNILWSFLTFFARSYVFPFHFPFFLSRREVALILSMATHAV